MAEIDSYTKPKKLASEINSLNYPPNHSNTSKYFSHFLYKALIVIIFLIIIPLFPSQAPEFINQSVSTRSWELLHLLFVGIAVSYGLFSRKTEETEKDNNGSKFDNAQSYVSRFLQVSSVFDDEAEIQPGSDENKVQTWSNQYYRNEPVVVVAQEGSVLDQKKSNICSRIGEKPLLLPVRSLKSRSDDYNNGDFGTGGSVNRSNSNSGSKRFSSNSSKARNGEFRGANSSDLQEKSEENFVLRSPVPWRSRSGRMEMKEEIDGGGSPPLYNLPPSMEETDFNRSFRSQTSKSSKPNSSSSSLSPSPSLSSPKKFSPSPSSSSESQAKNVEDSVRKKSFYKSTPPPAPPPPPPIGRKLQSVKSNTTNGGIASEKEFRRSLTSEKKEFGRSGGEEILRRVNSAVNVNPKTLLDSSSMGKSVRTVRVKNAKEVVEDEMDYEYEDEAIFMEKPVKKTVKFDQTVGTAFSDFQKVTVETDDDDDDEDDDDGDVIVRRPENEGGGGKSTAVISDGGPPDVDKKADEFIAKFREQIRLQRIESIKRSSGQINRNSSR